MTRFIRILHRARGLLLAAFLLCPAAGARAESPACGDCHEGEPSAFAETVHGFLDCTDCHAGAAEMPHLEEALAADCGSCHADEVDAWSGSIHGMAVGLGIGEAPGCTSCHGAVHDLVPGTDPASPVHPARLPETCGVCHADPELARRFEIPISRPMESYRDSVHARAVRDGRGGATCSDCHDSHGVLSSSNPRSSVHHSRVPETCGACHAEITASFQRSVHGRAAAHGVREAPVCTDCHGEHRITSPREPGSPQYATNIPLQTCGRCHSDARISEKYGLPSENVPAYEDSYHGLAARAGRRTVANCASCHGVHDILPSSDPASHVHPSNLAATCGQCHPGAGEQFAIGKVHINGATASAGVTHWVRVIYIPLIIATVLGMLLHNLLDLARKQRTFEELARAPSPRGEERLSLGFRLAHGLNLVSFVVLVYTGFALKYPESWWARPLIAWEADYGLRGILHRVAAVGLLAAVALHGLHLAVDRRARRCIAKMRPGLADWHELRQRIAYYLGMRATPPHGIRVSYVEKVEYLAFLWGVVIMSITGFVLWFENLTLHWLPTWVLDASTAVHFYEAILASLAILVWHGYWVVFDPAVYPMDWAWWTGRSPEARERERAPASEESHGPSGAVAGNRRSA